MVAKISLENNGFQKGPVSKEDIIMRKVMNGLELV
jgi:hypothetical protein